MSSIDARIGSADPVRVLLLCLAAVIAAIGALRDLPLLALAGGLAALLALALAPALNGRRLPRIGLALLGVVLLAWYVPVFEDDWLVGQFVRRVIVAVCVTVACAALFSGTGPGPGSALGGILMALIVLGSITAAVDSWTMMQDLGHDAWIAVDDDGGLNFGVLYLLAAAALLVLGGRRASVRRSSRAA